MRYAAAFTGQDWDLVHREYFTEDVHVQFPSATLTGAAESAAWFRTAYGSPVCSHPADRREPAPAG